MKKLFFINLCVFIICGVVSAQDIITPKDGADIEAKILEVSPNEIRYKLFSEPEGATYIVKKSDVLLITYESGRRDIFNERSYSDLYTSSRNPIDGITPGMKYKQLKNLYDYKQFSASYSDRYSPGWSGVASFFIPGLGECINNEWGRGLSKFFGNIALSITANALVTASYYDYYPTYMYDIYGAIACYVAILSIDIWSIVDAVRIAKVKNMYEQDLRKLYTFDIELRPSINYTQIGNQTQYAPGVTLAINF